MSTRCEIQAPGWTKASATATCGGSSRASRRTRTLVSTARMPCPHVLPDALLELLQASRPRLLGEQRPVEVLEGVPTDTPDGDAIIFGVPLQHGAGHELEALA